MGILDKGKILLFSSLGFALVSCSSEVDDAGLRKSCPYSIESGPDQVLNPDKPTSCTIAIMSCNYCDYDEAGEFSGASTEICGVCMQTSEF